MLKAQTEDFKSSDNSKDNENTVKQIPIKTLHIADTYLHNLLLEHLKSSPPMTKPKRGRPPKNVNRIPGNYLQPFTIHQWEAQKEIRLRLGNITDTDLKRVLLIIGRQMSYLRKFDIELLLCGQISHRGLENIGPELGRNLPYLQDLTLFISKGEMVRDQALTVLALDIVKYFANLKRLSLMLLKCNITDSGVKAFSSIIESHVLRIQNLDLTFSMSKELSDEALNILGINIGKNHRNLQGLSLSFANCYNVTDKGLADLGSNLGTWSMQLKQLSLNFSYISQPTDKSLISLFSNVSRQATDLEDLSLAFYMVDNITDQGIEALAMEIGNRLKKLKQLKLDFSWSKGITNKGMAYLESEIMKNLTELQKIDLKFINTGITPDYKSTLASCKSIPFINVATETVH